MPAQTKAVWPSWSTQSTVVDAAPSRWSRGLVYLSGTAEVRSAVAPVRGSAVRSLTGTPRPCSARAGSPQSS